MHPVPASAGVVRCGRLLVSRDGAFARFDSDELDLTFAQRRVLAVLAQRAGKVYARADLYAAAFQRPLPAGSRAVDQLVVEIRRGLGERRHGLGSIDRVGYRLVPEVFD